MMMEGSEFPYNLEPTGIGRIPSTYEEPELENSAYSFQRCILTYYFFANMRPKAIQNWIFLFFKIYSFWLCWSSLLLLAFSSCGRVGAALCCRARAMAWLLLLHARSGFLGHAGFSSCSLRSQRLIDYPKHTRSSWDQIKLSALWVNS